MPKSMAWNEAMKLGRGEGRLKNHPSFLLPSRDWSAGKKKSPSGFSMSSKGCTGECCCSVQWKLLFPHST